MLQNDDAGVLGQYRDKRIIVVFGIVVNALNATRSQRSEAVDAGVVRDINGCVLQAGAATRAVADRIDFAVDDGLLVVVTQAADVRGAGDVAVIPHGDDAMVLHDNGTHTQARARAAHGCQESNGHEVVVPRHGFQAQCGSGGGNLEQHFNAMAWHILYF